MGICQVLAQRVQCVCGCVCVCVCVKPCYQGYYNVIAGGQRRLAKLCPTKLFARSQDIQPDQLDVPAISKSGRGHLTVQLVANFCGRFYMSGRHSHVHACQCSSSTSGCAVCH